MRKNEAAYSERFKRWQIKVQIDGERPMFTCSIRDYPECNKSKCSAKCKKGKISAEKKADYWIAHRTVNDNTRCDILLDQFLERIELTGGTSHNHTTENFVRIRIRPRIGCKKVGALRQDDLQAIIDHAYVNMEEGWLDKEGNYTVNKRKGMKLSAKTLRNIRATVMSFVQFCRDKGVSNFHPETLKIPTSAKKSKKTILHVAEIVKLFTIDTTRYKNEIVKDRFIHAYRWAVVTGMRPGEIIGLMDDDITGSKVTIGRSINTYKELTDGKNENAPRTYTLDTHALTVRENQRAMLMDLGQISPYVFPGKNLSNATQNQLYNAWKRYCETNGIKNATTPYELRHTFVSVNTNMPDALKRLVMGHSENMDTQGIYGHEKADDMEAAAQHITEAFAKILGW